MTRDDAKTIALGKVRTWEHPLRCLLKYAHENKSSRKKKLASLVAGRLVHTTVWVTLLMLVAFKWWATAGIAFLLSCCEVVCFLTDYYDPMPLDRTGPFVNHVEPSRPWPRI